MLAPAIAGQWLTATADRRGGGKHRLRTGALSCPRSAHRLSSALTHLAHLGTPAQYHIPRSSHGAFRRRM